MDVFGYSFFSFKATDGAHSVRPVFLDNNGDNLILETSHFLREDSRVSEVAHPLLGFTCTCHINVFFLLTRDAT